MSCPRGALALLAEPARPGRDLPDPWLHLHLRDSAGVGSQAHTGPTEHLRRKRKSKVGRSWYVDETYIRVRGQWRYLYRATDRDGALVDVMLSEHREWRPPSDSFDRP